VLDDKLKIEIEKRSKKVEPYVLWGVVNTVWDRTGKDGTQTADPTPKRYPALVIQTLNHGIRISDIKSYQDKGFVLLHHNFPKQDQLPSQPKGTITSESGWKMELRADASYFNEVRQYCEEVKAGAVNPLQSVVSDQAKELEELRALHSKSAELKSGDKPRRGRNPKGDIAGALEQDK